MTSEIVKDEECFWNSVADKFLETPSEMTIESVATEMLRNQKRNIPKDEKRFRKRVRSLLQEKLGEEEWKKIISEEVDRSLSALALRTDRTLGGTPG